MPLLSFKNDLLFYYLPMLWLLSFPFLFPPDVNYPISKGWARRPAFQKHSKRFLKNSKSKKVFPEIPQELLERKRSSPDGRPPSTAESRAAALESGALLEKQLIYLLASLLDHKVPSQTTANETCCGSHFVFTATCIQTLLFNFISFPFLAK